MSERLPMHWLGAGTLLAAVFLAAVILVKPIGVSTQFVIFDGILWNALDTSITTPSETAKSGYTSTNAYLDKSGGSYAKSVENPMNYSFVFVVAMALGAALSAVLRGGVPAADRTAPPIWRANYGDAAMPRYAATFLAGFIVLYGARLAGGCTSGHMMSGMMQTSVSGYLFALGAFAAAIPVAMFLYRKEA